MHIERLRVLADMLIRGEAAADIGADHALLSVFLVKENIVPWLVASEFKDGPYLRLSRTIQNSPYRDRIKVRQGDGLEVLTNGEVGNVIIAGMGGDTIVEILSSDWRKAASFSRFVFQAMSRSAVLRQALAIKGWPILDERLVWEKGRFYTLISSCPGEKPYSLSPLQMELGSAVFENNSKYKMEYIKTCRKKYDKIYRGLLKSGKADEAELARYRELLMKLEEMSGAGKG